MATTTLSKHHKCSYIHVTKGLGVEMEEVGVSGLPSDKDSKKYFLISEHAYRNIPFEIVPLKILTPNGQSLVRDFRETKGEFLGGGVMKSDDFEREAQQNPNAMAVKQRVEMQFAFMSKTEALKMSTQITSEWIAFEYSLVISQTLYGLITSIKWDHLESITSKRKGVFGQATAELKFRNNKDIQKTMNIQSSQININSLKSIASACGVLVL